MIRKLVRSLGLLAIVGGALMISVPAFAYVDTSPGSGGSVSASTVQPGSAFSFTATFTDLPAGTSIAFSSSCSGTTMNPASAALDANHQATTSVVIPSSCAGQTVTLTATAPGGATVSASVTVAGGFPNTTAAQQSIPFGWFVIALGVLLLIGGTFGLSRGRRRSEMPSRA
ncbi:MAG TPA: hypothetical protein VF134_02005 [Candidatus Dormibacteraeota bacterium]